MNSSSAPDTACPQHVALMLFPRSSSLASDAASLPLPFFGVLWDEAEPGPGRFPIAAVATALLPLPLYCFCSAMLLLPLLIPCCRCSSAISLLQMLTAIIATTSKASHACGGNVTCPQHDARWRQHDMPSTRCEMAPPDLDNMRCAFRTCQHDMLSTRCEMAPPELDKVRLRSDNNENSNTRTETARCDCGRTSNQ